MIALACAPSAFADDSLLGPVTAVTGDVAVGDVLEAAAPVAVEVPAVPVPTVPAPDVQAAPAPAAIKIVTDGAGSVQRALPPLPKPDAAVATVTETIAEVTRAIAPVSAAPTPRAAATRPRATVEKRSPAAPARAMPTRAAPAERAAAQPESPRRIGAAATTSPRRASGAGSTVLVREAVAVTPTAGSTAKLVHPPTRQAAPERSAPLPVPSAPARSSTTGAAAGGAEGFWPVCAGLLLFVLLGRRLGPRLLQLVPEPHPHALLLRLERPG